MSRSRKVTIRCSSCGREQPFVAWESINVSVDPDLKQLLLDGVLTTFRCDYCGHEAHIEYDCLYHDMDRNLALWLKYPGSDGQARVDPLTKGLFSAVCPTHTRRLVYSFHELVDKIRVFDDGLSDHVVELLKLLICVREGIDVYRPFHYIGVRKSLFASKCLVFALQTEQGFVEKKYPLKQCLDAVRPLVPKVAPFTDASDDEWPHVDRRCILRVLEAGGLMRRLESGE